MGSANGVSLKPLTTLPTMYAPLLRKNSEDSTCTWKLVRQRKAPSCSPTAFSTRSMSRPRSSNSSASWKFQTMRMKVSRSVSCEG